MRHYVGQNFPTNPIMKRNILFIVLFIYSFSLRSQYADCSNAVNICQNATFQIDPNGTGAVQELLNNPISNPSTNPASGNSGCLLSGELNPTWMVINVASTGTLEFSFGADGGIGCLDWIMWPYTPNSCNQIINNQLAPIRCNWNGACESFTGVSTPPPPGGDPNNFEPELIVTAGQQFLICLSNYSSQSTVLPLNFFGTANVSCTAVQPVTVNNVTICPGQTATLTANSPGATSFTWSNGATTPTITVSPTTTTTYTVNVSAPAPNGATGTGSATATVIVLPSTNPLCGCTVTASNTGPICIGSTFNLNSVGVTNGTYDWSLSGTSIGSTQNLTTVPAPTVGSYPITVTATDAIGNVCTSTTIVLVNPLPAVNAGNDVSTCLGNSVSLSGSGATTYQWNGGIQNATPFSPTINNTYTVTGTDVNGCVNTDDVTVTMLYAQMPSITPSITAGCVPSQVVFTNNDPQAQNCIWSFGNGATGNGCTPQQTTFNEVGCYDVSITQTDFQGCDTTVVFNDIVCIEEAIAAFYVNPGTIGPGNSLVNFYNVSEGAVSYNWDFGDGQSSTAPEPTNTYSTNLQTGFTATLIATSPAGCSDTTSMPIGYEEQLIYYVPNSFTPDADEHNQLFTPIFTSGFSPEKFEMMIFNRWGELIWQSFDPTKGWDGSYGIEGLDAQSGTYTWVIFFKPKANDDKIKISGFVNLLR
jgi:gliding motility-associated-like protein